MKASVIALASAVCFSVRLTGTRIRFGKDEYCFLLMGESAYLGPAPSVFEYVEGDGRKRCRWGHVRKDSP